MLKKAHYTTFTKEIIIELQKTVEGIFNLELEQFKAKLEKALSDSITERGMQNEKYNDLKNFRDN